MRSVGIEELRADLSCYMRMARGGEQILVTDRDEVVAQLGPPRRQASETGSYDDVLGRLARGGQITRSRQPKTGWSWSPRPLGLPSAVVAPLLDEIREDR